MRATRMKTHSLSLYKNQFSPVLDGSEEESLQRLGKILHFSKSRSLIVKCDETRFVRMGTRACDSKLKEIGKVQDIFGPVSGLYLSIRPTVSSPVKYVGRVVYSFD